MTPYNQYGAVTEIREEEFPQESICDIQFVLPEHADYLKTRYPIVDFIDLGGGTRALTYQAILKRGKKYFAKQMELCASAEETESLWEQILSAAREESSYYP